MAEKERGVNGLLDIVKDVTPVYLESAEITEDGAIIKFNGMEFKTINTSGVKNGLLQDKSHNGVDYAQEGKDISALSVKVKVDVSGAVAGLKAVQREARKAAQELREVEASYTEDFERLSEHARRIGRATAEGFKDTVDFTTVSTKELHEELARREGAREYVIEPHEYARIKFLEDGSAVDVVGPARILVNVD